MVRKRRRRVVEIGEWLEPSVEDGDRAEPVTVGEDSELRRRLNRVVEAEAGGVPKRDRRAADYGQETERARPFGEHLGTGNEKRLRQSFVLGEPQADP